MIRTIPFILLHLEVLREKRAPKVLKVHLRGLPIFLGRKFPLGNMRGDTEHVLPRNKLLDILQSHGFYADTFDYSTGEEIFSGDKTFAIGIH
jgi:hypothetical protein